jgi:DNA-binding transcriptional LysR family regulator
MDLRVLRTFVAVAELRHFARAASVCNLSQPAVSHQIAQLEEEVGTKLFNRTGRAVSLTVAGDVMLEEARRILAAVDRARERMQEVVRGAVGRIRLGASPTPGLYLLPALLAKYRSRHAAYDLHFEIGSAQPIAERVAQNDLDMGIIASSPPTAELQTRPLVQDELVLVASPSDRLSRAAAVRAGSLNEARWILREEGSETRQSVITWWQRHRIQPVTTMEFPGPEAVKRAVMAGLGVAMVSRLTVEDELASGRLVAVDVKSPLPVRQLLLIDHPQKHHGAACRGMLALVGASFPASPVAPVPGRRGRQRLPARPAVKRRQRT